MGSAVARVVHSVAKTSTSLRLSICRSARSTASGSSSCSVRRRPKSVMLSSESGKVKDTDASREGSKAPLANETLQNANNNGSAASDTAVADADKPLSKNQLKKKRRWEKAMEVKKRRKQQEKEIKIAKAKAAGRDLEKERLDQLQRTEEGSGKKKRQEEWERTKAPLVQQSFQCCIDCSFESLMTSKEINSLSGQIRYCYSNNRRNVHPCKLTVTSLSGQTFANLQNVSGFDEWNLRAFDYSDKPLNEVFQDRLKDIVYLTSDSENVVEELDDSKIYVIGGIVDRNRLQRAAITRAEKLGVATARLPLESYLQKMKTTKVLTCNHVFEILLKYREHGKSWEKALLEVLPSRKDVAPASAAAARKEEPEKDSKQTETEPANPNKTILESGGDDTQN